MFSWYLRWLERTGRCFVIRDKDGSVYLKRYYIFFNGKKDNLEEGPKQFSFNVFLHHIVRSDNDRELHDHPWNFTSIILKGGYWEETFFSFRNDKPKDRIVNTDYPSTKKKWIGPSSINSKKATDFHRLEMGDKANGTWTLFFRGKKQRKWGFWTKDGWVDFETYLNERNIGIGQTEGEVKSES